PRDAVGDLDARQRDVAGGADVVRPGHGAAGGDEQAGGGVVVRPVGQLDDADVRRVAEVVVGVAGGGLGGARDRGAGGVAGGAGGGADVGVLAGDRRAAGGELPGLARLEQAVVVAVA